jgi:hypothetical protein
VAVSPGKLNGYRFLLMILAAALVLRGLCAILFESVIDPEGAEYARIAENILLGSVGKYSADVLSENRLTKRINSKSHCHNGSTSNRME